METSGLKVDSCNVLELGCSDGIEEYTCRVQYTGVLHPRITEITGIRSADVVDAPPFRTGFTGMLEFIRRTNPQQQDIALCAYNGFAFDFPILLRTAQQNGVFVGIVFEQLKIRRLVDTLHWARDHYRSTTLPRGPTGRPSYKLGNVYTSIFGTTFANAHSAGADARAVLDLTVRAATDHKLDIDDRNTTYTITLSNFQNALDRRRVGLSTATTHKRPRQPENTENYTSSIYTFLQKLHPQLVAST